MNRERYEPIAKELIDKMAQMVIDYFKEHPCEDVDEIAFHFDDLKASIEEGKWHPASDGALTLWSWGLQDEDTVHGRTELITYM